MPNFIRAFRPGGTFFITLVTEGRQPLFANDLARSLLHQAISACGAARPFRIDAIVLLPDHVHMLLKLPSGDSDYSTRLASIKARFTHDWLGQGGAEQSRSSSRRTCRRRGVWQRRFWEHTIRDGTDLERHLHYIHWNPIKHGLCACAHAWPYSSFSRWVAKGAYRPDWQCHCRGQAIESPDFAQLQQSAME